ncbi:MAG: hypothetical protein ACTSXH_18325 [Promethearchaeota archaeon]
MAPKARPAPAGGVSTGALDRKTCSPCRVLQETCPKRGGPQDHQPAAGKTRAASLAQPEHRSQRPPSSRAPCQLSLLARNGKASFRRLNSSRAFHFRQGIFKSRKQAGRSCKEESSGVSCQLRTVQKLRNRS